MTRDNTNEVFGGQKLLAYDVWPFFIQILPETYKGKFDVDFVLAPTVKKGDKRRSGLNEHVFGVTTASKNPNEAFKVVSWFGSKELNVQGVIQGQKGPIARPDFWADQRVFDKHPAYKKLLPIMQSIEPDFTVANFRGEEFDNAYAQVFDGVELSGTRQTPRRPRFRSSPRPFWTRIRHRGGPRKREALEGYLSLAPWALGFVLFVAGPILASLVLSFTKYNVIRPPEFIGLGNYVTALTKDDIFFPSIGRTFYYAALVVPIGLALSLGVAMLLNRALLFTTLWRTFFFLPTLTPVVAAAVALALDAQSRRRTGELLARADRDQGPGLACLDRMGDPLAGADRTVGQRRRQPNDHLPGRPAVRPD